MTSEAHPENEDRGGPEPDDCLILCRACGLGVGFVQSGYQEDGSYVNPNRVFFAKCCETCAPMCVTAVDGNGEMIVTLELEGS